MDYPDGRHGGHLAHSFGAILAIFYLQVTLMLLTKFRVSLPFDSGEAKNRFSRLPPWRPSWIPIGTILAIFDLQVTPMLLTKFRVNWPLGSGVEANNRFSRWQQSWISYRNNCYFLPTSHPDASYKVSSQLAFWFRRRSEKYIFKMAAVMAILHFQTERFKLSFIYKSSRCFLPSFKSIGLSFQEKKRKIDFQYGRHGGHLGYPIGMILAIFASHPDAFYQVWSQYAHLCSLICVYTGC